METQAMPGPSGTPEGDEAKKGQNRYPRWGLPVVAVLVVVFTVGMCVLAWALQREAGIDALLYARLAIVGATLAISSAFVLVVFAGMSYRSPPAGVPSREHTRG